MSPTTYIVQIGVAGSSFDVTYSVSRKPLLPCESLADIRKIYRPATAVGTSILTAVASPARTVTILAIVWPAMVARKV